MIHLKKLINEVTSEPSSNNNIQPHKGLFPIKIIIAIIITPFELIKTSLDDNNLSSTNRQLQNEIKFYNWGCFQFGSNSCVNLNYLFVKYTIFNVILL